MSESSRARWRLISSSRRMLSVQEEERKRISRELHDVIAQLNRQVVQQRIDALLDLQRGGTLDAAGKQELRDLLAQRGAGIASG